MQKFFCIPYAGGSSNIYAPLQQFLNNKVNLFPIELSARGSRIREPLYKHFTDAVDDVYKYIIDNTDQSDEINICGYSLGSLIGFETIVKLESNGFRVKSFIAAANVAPSEEVKLKDYSENSEREFMDEIKELGGVTDELINNKIFKRLYYPVIYNDYKLLFEYRRNRRFNKIRADIYVLYGNMDFSHSNIQSWKLHTHAKCYFEEFEGNHFFINNNYKKFAEVFNEISES